MVGVWTPPDGGRRLGCYPRDCAYDLVTMEGRIKRLERYWDHPDNPGPDPEMVAHWASLFTNAEIGIDESRAKAAALEFLLDCQARGQTPTFGYGPGGLLSWCEGNIGGGEDRD